jgi:hypothetical protein
MNHTQRLKPGTARTLPGTAQGLALSRPEGR